MDIQEYKNLSIKLSNGQPLRPWHIYNHCVIKTLENHYDTKEYKRAMSLWNKSFKECIDSLPRSKKFIQFFYWDKGLICAVIITEKYKCGFEVNYTTNDATLSYDSEDDTRLETFKHFDELCARANDLIDSEFNIFMEMANSYKALKDALIFFHEHITYRHKVTLLDTLDSDGYPENASDYLCDNQVIYRKIYFTTNKDIENWKV